MGDSDASGEHHNTATRRERASANRVLIIFAHVISAVPAAVIPLSHAYQTGEPRGLVLVRYTVLLCVSPYIVSLIYSRRRATDDRARSVAFALVLIAGSVVMIAVQLHPWVFGVILVPILFVVQGILYLGAADFLLGSRGVRSTIVGGGREALLGWRLGR